MKKIIFAIICSFSMLQAAPSALNVIKTFVELGVDMGFSEDEVSLKDLSNIEKLDDNESVSIRANLVSVSDYKDGYKLYLTSDDVNASAIIDLKDNADIMEAIKELRDEIASESEFTLKNNEIKSQDFIDITKKEVASLKDSSEVELVCAKVSKVEGQIELEDCYLNNAIIDFTSQTLLSSLKEQDIEALSAIFKLMIGVDDFDKLKLDTKEQRQDFINSIMNDVIQENIQE